MSPLEMIVKELQKGEVIKMEKFEINNDKISVTDNGNSRINNYTLEELKQKLINEMYKLSYYSQNEIEILKILFNKKD